MRTRARTPVTCMFALIVGSLWLAACRYDQAGFVPLDDAGTDLPVNGVDASPPDQRIPVESAPPCGSICEAEMSDGCCPVGCTAGSDFDCAAQCGNGVVEGGEECDPRGTCPGSCPIRGCTRFTLQGSAAMCTAVCVESGEQTGCVNDDGCCPAGCSGTADNDCLAECDNGIKEGAESCDPLASCPSSCPAEACQLRKLINPGTCSAQCVNDRQQTLCATGDSCCPPGCHARNDGDCMAACDNGTKESGETCDPLSSCPGACPPVQCQLRKLVNAGTCQAACEDDAQVTACTSGDDCCPPGCNSTNDQDCSSMCGNGIKEAGETCDPVASCPASCPAMGCQLRELVNPGTCRAACQNSRLQTMCAPGDGCCPPSCNSSNDSDCRPACGNGVVEKGETCDPVAECTRRQTACVNDQNTTRTRKGNAAACTFECVSMPRPCGPADGFCPAGCAVDPNCLPRPTNCTSLQWCAKPTAPNQGQVICLTNDNPRCTVAERKAECATDARRVCGAGHAAIHYQPAL